MHRDLLFSQRTQKYIEALIREGDNFDYAAWLKRVRDEESVAKARRALVVLDYNNHRLADREKQAEAEVFAATCAQPGSKLLIRPWVRQFARPLRFRSAPSYPSLTRRILAVQAVWKAMKHRRNAIFCYLSEVFKLVTRCEHKKQIKQLMECAFKLSGHPAGKNINTFALIITCTCDSGTDRKTISRWSRALRYVAARKNPEMSLKEFMQGKGGINACADRFAVMRKHSHHAAL